MALVHGKTRKRTMYTSEESNPKCPPGSGDYDRCLDDINLTSTVGGLDFAFGSLEETWLTAAWFRVVAAHLLPVVRILDVKLRDAVDACADRPLALDEFGQAGGGDPQLKQHDTGGG